MLKEKRSQAAFKKAQEFFPGGVNSPVRAFGSVGGNPFFVAKGEGAELTDIDGNRYIDFVLSWGPLVLGHSAKGVRRKIKEALDTGWTYGAPTELETQLAQAVQDLVPSMKLMRMVNSGTEAVMGALRAARGFTGRDIVIKCDGGYHGHSDGLLCSAGSGLATLGTSSSAGVPEAYASCTIVIPINDYKALEAAFKKFPKRIAAFILEPVAGNVGVIPPAKGFLKKAKDLCHKFGSLIIFDEVMCGFRASVGGAQALYGVEPDLTTLGKVIGGGLPVGAYGGRKEIMELVAPLGPVYQAGTLSGNPAAMAAGLETLRQLKAGAHDKAEKRAAELEDGLNEIIKKQKIEACVQRVGTMLSLFLCKRPVVNYQDTAKVNKTVFATFHRELLERGVFFAPSPFEAAFLSSAHTPKHIQKTLEAVDAALEIAYARHK